MSGEAQATIPVSWRGGPKDGELGGITEAEAAVGVAYVPDGADPRFVFQYDFWAERSEMIYQGRAVKPQA